MLAPLIDKAKGFLLNPVETFWLSKDDREVTVLPYFAALLLINAILTIVVTIAVAEYVPAYASMMKEPAFPVLVFIGTIVLGIVVTLVFAAWLHLWVYIFGGRKGITQTVLVVIYGSTPRLLLGWIPIVGLLFALWSVVLGVLGIRELQELSTGKAIAVVAIAVIIPLVVIVLIALLFLVSYISVNGVPVPPTNAVI